MLFSGRLASKLNVLINKPQVKQNDIKIFFPISYPFHQWVGIAQAIHALLAMQTHDGKYLFDGITSS